MHIIHIKKNARKGCFFIWRPGSECSHRPVGTTVAKRNLIHHSHMFAAWQKSYATCKHWLVCEPMPVLRFMISKQKTPTRGVFFIWRPGSESNRHRRICSPLHNHSATRPEPANLYYAKNICNSTEKCLLYKINLIQRECT